MKNLIVLLAICSPFLGVSNSFADSLQRHTLEVGHAISNLKYEEHGIMKSEGLLFGVHSSYTHRSRERLMMKAEGRYGYGKVDYESTNSGTMDNIDDHVLELRVLGGYDFRFFERVTMTPYIGVGYRYLNDDSSGRRTSTGHYGYERESNYYYSPIGVETTTELRSGWILGIILEYDYFWKGKQISHLSDVPGYSDVENDQNEGYGFRGSMRFQLAGECIDFAIEPFIRYWDIDESEWKIVTHGANPYGYGYEPENESTEVGLNITIRF